MHPLFEQDTDCDQAGSAQQVLSRISDYFLNKEERFGHLGLYSGDSGIMLLFAQLYLQTHDERYAAKLDDYLDGIIETIDSNGSLRASFCDGLAGFGWLVCFLREKELIEIDEEYFDDIDTLLGNHLQVMRETHYFDPIHGMISIGRYFLRRGDVEKVRYTIQALAELAEYEDSEIRWVSSHRYKQPSYDFGLAHGMAGILYFIGKSFELGVEPELCRKLGSGIQAFFQHNEQKYQTVGCYYPYHIDRVAYQVPHAAELSRQGWCYGDLCILTAIYRYALRVGDQESQRDALEKLIVTTKRRDLKETTVRDAQFCHGSSCLLYMYGKLYRDTGIPEFREAALYWLQITLDMGNSDQAATGYLFMRNYKEQLFEPLDTMLEGLCGVGLALVSTLQPDLGDWDESMMLD